MRPVCGRHSTHAKRPKASRTRELRQARLALPPRDPHPPALRRVVADGEVHREPGREGAGGVPCGRGGDPDAPRLQHGDQRQVDPAHGLRLELAAQEVQGGLRLRAEDGPACVRVEPVDVSDLAAEAGPHEVHERHGRPLAPVRGHGKPARLVEGDEGLVLKEDFREVQLRSGHPCEPIGSRARPPAPFAAGAGWPRAPKGQNGVSLRPSPLNSLAAGDTRRLLWSRIVPECQLFPEAY